MFFEWQADGATEFVEAGALAVGAGGTIFVVVEVIERTLLLCPEFVEGLLRHPVEELAVAAAGGAPAAWAVPREVLGVEFGEGLAGGRVGALGRGSWRAWF